MDKPNLAKQTIKYVVGTFAGAFVKDTLENSIPATQKMHIAGIAGFMAGVVISEKLEPRINKIVDNFFATR
jgi:outer membrane lipoprotein SlyB